MEKVWVIQDPDEQIQGYKTRRLTQETLPSDGKNPAAAYSLSIIFWGGGQIYNDQRAKGLLFLFTMIILFTGTVLSFVYWEDLHQVLLSHKIAVANVFIIAELLFFCALIFWTYNAGDAYHKAVKARTMPFAGIQSRAYPFLCSLIVPGWGQFLNGQPIKGSMYAGFSVLGIFSFVSIPSVLQVWPFLEAVESRFLIEEIFVLTLLFAPFIPFIWVFGSFDALKVSLDDIKKESFFDRIMYANNRRRTQGWMRGVYPHIKTTVFLVLFLTFLVIVIDGSSLRNYYFDQLTYAQGRLQERGMTIVPEIINRVLLIIALAGK
jgi:TM2 domain-containing membrane protein YozV